MLRKDQIDVNFMGYASLYERLVCISDGPNIRIRKCQYSLVFFTIRMYEN